MKGWNSDGEYVEAPDADPFSEQRNAFYTNVQQQIEAGEYYPRDPIGQEDYMFYGLAGLFERGVITNTEAIHIYSSWIRKRRPDTTVIHVKPQPPSGAFYE